VLSFAWSGKPGGNEAHVLTSVGVDHDDDAAQSIEADPDESLLVLGLGVDRDGHRIEEYALGIGEPDAMLAEVRLSLRWIPDGPHICIICIYSLRASVSPVV
jgi:hypothetical protein